MRRIRVHKAIDRDSDTLKVRDILILDDLTSSSPVTLAEISLLIRKYFKGVTKSQIIVSCYYSGNGSGLSISRIGRFRVRESLTPMAPTTYVEDWG